MVLVQLCQQHDVIMKEEGSETSLIIELLCVCTYTCACIIGCWLLCRRLCVYS